MRRPLSFLHLTTFYPPHSFGGDAIFVENLARTLVEGGHQVDVVHCLDSFRLLSDGTSPPRERERHGVSVHTLESGLGMLSPLFTQQTGRPGPKASALRRILASKAYDVIHFHNISLLGPGVLSMQNGSGTPIRLYTAHEQWLICPTHVLWKYNSRPCEAPDCLSCTLVARRPPQWWRYTSLLERCCGNVDAFLSPSRFVGRIHAERGFAPAMRQLANFTERNDADWRDPPPRPHRRPYFLFVGRLHSIKGVGATIDAWKRVADADLLIAGKGPEEADLRRRAAGNPRIHFLGHLEQKDLGALYTHCLACLIPSLTYETFPLVVLESLSRKAPVIAHRIDALTELLEESGGGMLYENEDQLVDAVQRIFASADLRRQLGESGYATFTERWTPQAHLKSYFEIIDEVALEKLGRLPWGNASHPRDQSAAAAVQ